ncbi:hypothetical protein ELH77_19150 [Rhizobium ruizarguesonis]|uniref:hypothetical protein n=1 Tax=Rhizobium ruizarguesonis TaxID=2081791 RepID=UPI001031D733|nr:hypothetical protein [Rhizobium ruizarguesonis]TAZ20724.1 hypothetical protein ELH77_19150 [Rhizobium ruizarguesonis]
MQPRLFKQEFLPGITRADLHEMMVAYGMLEFERRGAAPFMWIIKSGPHLKWIETPWENDFEKNLQTSFIRTLMQKMEAEAYSFMTEAWVAVETATPDGKVPADAIAPSQRPKNERDDVLVIYTFDKHGGFDVTRFLVTLRDNGRNYLGPRDDESMTGAMPSGRMWNLLAKEQSDAS